MTSYRSPVDIYELDDHFEIHADLPGVDTDDIAIDVDHENLYIKGIVKSADGKQEQAIWERSFQLNKAVDRDRIEADLQDGILRLTMPKPHDQQPRRIAVSAA